MSREPYWEYAPAGRSFDAMVDAVEACMTPWHRAFGYGGDAGWGFVFRATSAKARRIAGSMDRVLGERGSLAAFDSP